MLNHFTKLLKLYWSVIIKLSGGHDVTLENYHKEVSTWFECIKSSEVTKCFTSTPSDAEVNSALQEQTGHLEVKELLKLASLLLAYNTSLMKVLNEITCVEDQEVKFSMHFLFFTLWLIFGLILSLIFFLNNIFS